MSETHSNHRKRRNEMKPKTRMRLRRLKHIALGLALTAIAAPSAHAIGVPHAPATPASVPRSPALTSSFDWNAAGIGLAVGLAVALMLVAGWRALNRRRGQPATA